MSDKCPFIHETNRTLTCSVILKREMRARSQVEEGKSNYKEYTVFVANLPDDLDQYGLKGVFKKAGQVSDTYIPRSRLGRNAYSLAL